MGETKESHEERTAHEPREATLHSVVLVKITPVGSLVRLLRLQIPEGSPDIPFLPGQWVDLFCPGIVKAGGFTITSLPSKAGPGASTADRYIELAIKKSPENPVAAWLWQDSATILGQRLQIRVGGSFVFPPPGAPSSFATDRSARVVFVAGGVGINPLISMASHLGELNGANLSQGGTGGPDVVFLYSVQVDPEVVPKGNKDGDNEADRIPFLQRLASLFSREAIRGELRVFLTDNRASNKVDADSANDVLSCNEEKVPCLRRRITTADLDKAILGKSDRASNHGLDNIYVYICGVPTMTDVFVKYLTGEDGPGLSPRQVLCEKWW
ncbi:oxidoreductase-like protein [Sporothrix schenckii 1099-18]|uniref:Oxidoreductase-like protein n=1 Tax=Sporothrix schenckii 1099-18 TaxID=1397361 RepID=A0A0F2M4K0_SPOSC|nr:oxidoreductase-like protein [Sporothrix schenckii 1099-18]KJR83106.1 oxidoreductase-like protein [Sporothrix schenckii 1099-18]